MTVSRPRGRSRFKPCRLCVRAPRMWIAAAGWTMRFSLTGPAAVGKLAWPPGCPARPCPLAGAAGPADPIWLTLRPRPGNGFSQGTGPASPITRDAAPGNVRPGLRPGNVEEPGKVARVPVLAGTAPPGRTGKDHPDHRPLVARIRRGAGADRGEIES